MNDDEIIASTRDEIFRRNQGDVAQGRDWGVVIPALLRRIEHLPMNSKPTPELMATCLAALMQNQEMTRWVRIESSRRNTEAGGCAAKDLWSKLAYEYAEALQNEYEK